LDLDNTRKAGRQLLEPLVKLLARLGVSPAAVTVSGLVMAGIAAGFIWNGLYWQGALLLYLGSILDAVDGGLARELGRESRAGAVLDSTLDRIGELFVLAAILTGTAGTEHKVLLYLVPAALGGSFMVSYVRARAEGVGIECSVGVFTRTERLVLIITGLVLAGVLAAGSSVLVWMLAVVSGGTWLTVAQRLWVVTRNGRSSRPES
jgi:CDP-diacylglycerol--glycerol-3-phosphate 3-phosphatidyltransferase